MMRTCHSLLQLCWDLKECQQGMYWLLQTTRLSRRALLLMQPRICDIIQGMYITAVFLPLQLSQPRLKLQQTPQPSV